MGVSIISEVLEVLNLVETVYPELAGLMPVLEKLVNGEATTDEDATAVITTRQALEVKAFPPSPEA